MNKFGQNYSFFSEKQRELDGFNKQTMNLDF